MKVLIFCLFLSTVSAQNGLSDKYRSIVRISSEVAEGDLSRAAQAMHEGLNAGLTIKQIKEVLIHTHAYCGFPRSI
jgi:4-carboxymuconolactone decarboxylase